MEPNSKLKALERMLPAAIIVGVMTLVASMSFRAVFDSWIFVVAPLIAVVGASAVSLFGAWRKLLLGEVVGLSFVSYLVFGVVAVGGVPVPASFVALLNGVTNGWIQILDSLPPADATGDLRALPFTAAWLGAAIGVEILRRSPRVGLPAIGPLIALSISILFSLGKPRLVLFQGVLLAVLFLLLVVVQHESKRDVLGDARTIRPTRLALGASILAGIAIAAPLVADFAVPDAPAGRIELRQIRPSPWDPLSVASPLTEVKGYLASDEREEIAFTISGPEVGRVRMAALEEYDGRVWAVADVADDAPAEFKPAGPSLPGNFSSEPPETHVIEIYALDTPWLPVVAGTSRIVFSEADAEGQAALQMNVVTGTVAYPPRVYDGMKYALESRAFPTPDGETLVDAPLSYDSARFSLDLLPPSLQNAAADVVEGIDPGWGQVIALQSYLQTRGFYAEEGISPGHSYARIGKFLSTLAAPVGYTEQYGAGGAVLARAVNLPSRVVLGFIIPEDRFQDGTAEVQFGDVSAWVEVLTQDHGWVAVDVTPDQSREPEVQAANKTTRIVASPNPPPPPPTSTTSTTIPLGADEEIEDQVVEEEEEQEEAAGLSGLPIVVKAGIIGIGLPIIIVLLLVFGAIAAKTITRSRRRKESDASKRIAGAWYETLDRFREAGYGIDRLSTPSELAYAFTLESDHVQSAGALDELAQEVDRAAFHPDAPTDDRAEYAWIMSDAAVGQAHAGRSTWQRLKMAADPRTILRPSRRGNPAGEKSPKAAKEGGSHAGQ